MFKHFLITRFNLKKSDWVTNKNNVAVLTDEWHSNRFKLFNTFCVPSVAGQVNKNFTWLVFFDSYTKKEFRKQISEIEQLLPNFSPHFIDGMAAFLPAIKHEIDKVDSSYIITSRLDNDDCLSENYINSVQQKFNQQKFLAIDYVNGYTLQIHPQVRLGYKIQHYNPFLSLIEKNDTPKTIWSIPHNHWKKSSDIIQIEDERIWSSIIHAENKVNEFTGFGNINISDFFKSFHIESKTKATLLTQNTPYKNWRFLSIKNKFVSYWNLYFKRFKKALGFYK